MKVTFFFDTIDIAQLASTIHSEGIAVPITTRPNVKTTFRSVQPLIQGTLLHLCVEGHDLDWYNYFLLTEVADVGIDDANEIVKKAAKQWEDAGYPWKFETDV